MDIGWTQAHVEAYAKGHYHLVNQQTANMVKDNEPDVPRTRRSGMVGQPSRRSRVREGT